MQQLRRAGWSTAFNAAVGPYTSSVNRGLPPMEELVRSVRGRPNSFVTKGHLESKSLA